MTQIDPKSQPSPHGDVSPDSEPAPLVSVITATMATFRPRRRQGLAEIYEDLQAQSMSNFEWILVTDGPKDALEDWVAQLADPRVRLLDSPPSHEKYKAMKKHYGGYVQKAKGVREARGPLIAHVDDDNRIYPDYLRRLSETIIEGALDFVICAIKTDYPAAPILRPAPPFPVFTDSGFDVLCLMIRREVIEGLGGWPEYGGAIEPIPRFGDDETLLRIIEPQGRYRILDDVLGYHRTFTRGA